MLLSFSQVLLSGSAFLQSGIFHREEVGRRSFLAVLASVSVYSGVHTRVCTGQGIPREAIQGGIYPGRLYTTVYHQGGYTPRYTTREAKEQDIPREAKEQDIPREARVLHIPREARVLHIPREATLLGTPREATLLGTPREVNLRYNPEVLT